MLFLILFFTSPFVFAQECIGPQKASHFLVYLHGMDTKTPGKQELENRKKLASIAEKLNLRIAIPRARDTCPIEKNLLCWGWNFNDPVILDKALSIASEAVQHCFAKEKNIGLLGFSNGGYVVNQVVKDCKKTDFSWFISAGAGGGWNKDLPNNLSHCGSLKLLAGKQDKSNYESIKEFATKLKNSKADVELIEYADGHLLPAIELEAAIKKKFSIQSFDSAKHPIRQESYWGDYKHKKLDDKLAPATPEMIDYMTQDNIKNGWPNRPQPVILSEKYRNDIIQALDDLPKDIADKINQKLTGIIFVKDLGGSAYSETVLDSKQNSVAGFVFLDISVLDKKANEWATWKEQSPFRTDPKIKLKAQIEDVKNNTRKNTLEYILLHEFGHILSIGTNSILPWGQIDESVNLLADYSFSNLSWRVENRKLVSIYDNGKLDRTNLKYYATEDQRLPAEKAQVLYSQLENTNFPTLYAATNPSDDFAESFATYIHSVRLKRPWKITLSSGNKKFFFELCWEKPRCQEKRKVLEKILAN